jgi:hypothetical protein
LRLQADTLIAGILARDLRAVFRHLNGRSICAAGFAERLSMTEAEAQRVLDRLVAEGCLAKEAWAPAGELSYGLDVKGAAIANARFLKPMSRMRADELVRQIVQRCESVNTNSELLAYVRQAVAFGSYANPASPDCADIDLALLLEQRPGIKDRKEFAKLSQVRFRQSGKSGGPGFLLLYGYDEVRKLIKARSPYISIHAEEDLKEEGRLTKVLFEADRATVVHFAGPESTRPQPAEPDDRVHPHREKRNPPKEMHSPEYVSEFRELAFLRQQLWNAKNAGLTSLAKLRENPEMSAKLDDYEARATAFDEKYPRVREYLKTGRSRIFQKVYW